MFRKLIAATPSPCGWFWKSRRNSWRQLARQRRRCRTRPRANQFHKEALHKKKGASRSKGIERLVAGGSGLHVAPGIDRRIVHADFVVNVRAGRAAADTRVADHLSALHARSGNGSESRKVRVPGRDAKPVVYDNQAAITGVVFTDGYDSVGSRVNWRAVIGSHIHPRVKCTLTAERVQTLTKTVSDVPQDRPDRRCVGGIGKARRRE